MSTKTASARPARTVQNSDRHAPPRSVWIFNHHSSTPACPAVGRHYSLARTLVQRGVEVTIFAAAYSRSAGHESKGYGRALVTRDLVDGVHFVWVRTLSYHASDWRRKLSMVYFAVVAVLAGLTRPRPDVVIGSTVHPFAALAGWVTATLLRARYIYEIRDLWPQTLVDLGALSPRSFGARLLWAIESFLVRRAETVISVLPLVADYLESRGLPSQHVRYLPNGPSLSEFDSARRRVLETPPGSLEPLLTDLVQRRLAGEVVFAYTGQHGRVNRLDVVVDALAIVNRTTERTMSIFFVGDGPEKERLIEKARQLGLANAIFHDPIPKDEVPALLASVDVGIVHTTTTPVYRYGISFNKLFDYMAAGLPVAFATTTAADPVEANGAGLTIAADDPGALALGMIALIDAGQQGRSEMGRRGRAYAEREHDMKILGARFAAILGVPETSDG